MQAQDYSLTQLQKRKNRLITRLKLKKTVMLTLSLVVVFLELNLSLMPTHHCFLKSLLRKKKKTYLLVLYLGVPFLLFPRSRKKS